jgi:hypothetical protein
VLIDLDVSSGTSIMNQQERTRKSRHTAHTYSRRRSSIFCWRVAVIGMMIVLHSPSSVVQCLSQLMVLGVGRVGRAVLDATHSRFDQGIGVVRSTTPIMDASDDDSNITFLNWQSDMDAILDRAKECTHLLVTLPPDVQGENCNAIAKCLSDNNAKSPTWAGIISTTGVYGNHNGEWVTELSECRGRKNYLEHENIWTERSFLGNNYCRFHIFRCAGIYGPNASALHTVYRDGFTSNNNDDNERQEDFPTSRIHLDDIVSAISASMDKVDDEDVSAATCCCCYNLSDDEPTNRSTVLSHAAELLVSIGVVLPDNNNGDQPKITTTGVRAQRRKTDNKRVGNSLLKEKLLPTLQYPTYREGLAAILHDHSCPWWQKNEHKSF